MPNDWLSSTTQQRKLAIQFLIDCCYCPENLQNGIDTLEPVDLYRTAVNIGDIDYTLELIVNQRFYLLSHYLPDQVALPKTENNPAVPTLHEARVLIGSQPVNYQDRHILKTHTTHVKSRELLLSVIRSQLNCVPLSRL